MAPKVCGSDSIGGRVDSLRQYVIWRLGSQAGAAAEQSRERQRESGVRRAAFFLWSFFFFLFHLSRVSLCVCLRRAVSLSVRLLLPLAAVGNFFHLSLY